MFTPQEIQERMNNLEKAVFGGYSMGAVEDLLTPLQKDYAELYKENAVLKSKMKVLVERMEKYRKQEERLNRAILAAQKTSDDLINETERKCARMTVEAEQRLRKRNEDLERELQVEVEKVNRAKADLQLQMAAEKDLIAQERNALQEQVAQEKERVIMAKKAAAAFVVELEERVQQQLIELEHIKELDLSVPQEETPPAEEPKTAAEPAGTAEKSVEKPVKPAVKPVKPAKAAVPPTEEALPKALSESEMSKQIERSLGRILADSMRQEQENQNKSVGETRTASPV